MSDGRDLGPVQGPPSKAPIHKLNPTSSRIDVPGTPVSVGNQRDKLALWYLADGTKHVVDFITTGSPIREENSRFLGTVLLEGGDFVVHAWIHP